MGETLPPNAVELAAAYVEDHDLFSLLGLEVAQMEPGETVLRIPYDERFTNPGSPPPIHGGIVATLVDSAGAFALRPHLEDPIRDSTATVTLDVNYLRPAAGDLTATTTVDRAGRTVGHTETTVEAETPDGGTETVAKGHAAYRIFR